MNPKTTSSKNVAANKISVGAESLGENDAYLRVRKLMDTNRVDEALTLARSRHDAPMKNAQGVCLMRKGNAEEAVRIYRTLVLDNTGLFMREQIPTVYKTNYALSLLLSGHSLGGINILKELSTEADHPSVLKLRSVVEAWKAKLSAFQKIGLMLGLDPKLPLVLDFPPGELL